MSLQEQEVELDLEINELIRRMTLGKAKTSKRTSTEEPEQAITNVVVPPHLEEIIGLCFCDNYKCRSQKEQQLMARLKLVKCHFTWNISTIKGDSGTGIEERLRKLKEKEESSPVVTYNILSYFHIVQLAYYHALCRELDDSLKLLRTATFMVENDAEQNIRNGLKYVVNGDRAFVLLLLREYEQCEKLLDTIPSYYDLTPEDAAAVKGTYGETLMELGIGGSEKAVEVFRDAVSLDPESYHWQSCLGVSLLRVRHYKDYRGIPTDEEHNALEHAAKLAPISAIRPFVYLAQCLREKGSGLFHSNPELNRGIANELNSRSKDLYDRVLEANPNCSARINIRCADGYMKLPGPYQDMDSAEICIEKALTLAGKNTMVNHKAATFCEISKKDYRMSLSYLEKALEHYKGNKAVFPIDIKMVDLKALLDKSFDPIGRLTEMKSIYSQQEASHVMSILCFRGLFWYMKHRDLDRAIRDWTEAMALDNNSFEKEFWVKLRSHSFMENSEYREMVMKLPRVLEDILLNEKDEVKITLFEVLLRAVKSFIVKNMLPQSSSYRGNQRGGRGRGYRGQRESRGRGSYRSQSENSSRSGSNNNWRC